MSAQRPQFDSHRFVKRLTVAGLPEEVAEILADEHTRLILPEDVATKGDVAAVSMNLATVRAEMATKADLATVKAETATKADLAACEARMEQRLQNAILEAKVSLIKWMIATMMVFSGIVIGGHDRPSVANAGRTTSYSTRQSRNASSTAAWMLRLETASPIRKS